MKKLCAALVALPFLAAPALAGGAGGGVLNFGFGANFTFFGNYAGSCGGGCGPCGPGGCGPGGGPAQLGPWYMYWPMEAHFQTPAPTGYPYWPAAQTLPNGAGAVNRDVAPAYYLQPASYSSGVPSYWYGR